VRALLQRVDRAGVRVEGREVASIGNGLLILLGVGHDDTEAVGTALAKRITELRIFADEAGRTNRSILDSAGSVLVVSQFTLYADTSRGRRPGFTNAAPPDVAERKEAREGVDELRSVDELVDDDVIADLQVVLHRSRRDLEGLEDEDAGEVDEDDRDQQRLEVLPARRLLLLLTGCCHSGYRSSSIDR